MKNVIIILCILLIPSMTAAEIISYEGFDYPKGSALTGLDGGSGWSSAWSTNSGSGGDVVDGLTYTDASGHQLKSTGGAYAVNAVSHFYQTLRDTQATFGAGGTSVWMSFIVQQPESISGVNYVTATLGTGYTFGSNAMLVGIGGPHPYIVDFYSGTSFVQDPTKTVGAGESAFLVARFDFSEAGNDTLNLWFNPILNEPPGEPLLSFSSKDYSSDISGITLAHGDNRSFIYDELRIGTDFASVTPNNEVFEDSFE